MFNPFIEYKVNCKFLRTASRSYTCDKCGSKITKGIKGFHLVIT